METMPSGGLGAGTIATSPELTRERSEGLCTMGGAELPDEDARASLRTGLVTRRKVGESIRSGTRLARMVARMVMGPAMRRACSGAVNVRAVSGCMIWKCC